MDSINRGTQQEVRYAGFWMRVAAYCIDYAVLFVLGFVMGFIFGLFAEMFFIGNEAARGTGELILMSLIVVTSLVVGWLYYALMESSVNQGTFGKMAFGLIVTDSTGGRLTFGRATGRYFAKVLSALTIYIGFLMIAFTKQKQGLHDLVAETLVVKKEK